MSYVDPGVGEDFSARCIFKLDGPIPLRWAVTHEFSTNVGGDSGSIDGLVETLATFHTSLLLPVFALEKIVVSTLAEDGSPYDPTTFKVYEFGAAGTRTGPTGEAYALESCVLVARVASSGRNGHMMLRGYLTEDDVQAVGGRVSLADLGAVQGEITDQITVSGLNAFLSGGSPADAQLYMISPGLIDNDERAISTFLAQRLTSKKLNNKYFDRA